MALAQGTVTPLIGAHAELEKTCKSCHEPFAQKSQAALCLACHKPIAADRQAKRNDHGRHPEALASECKACHTEHKGRTFDIVQLNRETFNHAFANFTLTGSHKRASCDGCHVKNTKYRETPGRCFDCHRSIDPHKGRLGEKCEGCHGEEAWRRVKPFDHSKTKFALVGAHREITCGKCHAGERNQGLATTCGSCHGLQDKHAGRNGSACETCLTPTKWAAVTFDHNKATRFPLRRFDHDKQTRYPLTGAHRALQCHACHTVSTAAKVSAPSTCYACHGQNDVHDRAFGRACEKCHTTACFRQRLARQ